MDRMRPSDAFAGEFCEAKGGGGGPLRAGVAGADLCGSQILRRVPRHRREMTD